MESRALEAQLLISPPAGLHTQPSLKVQSP